MWIQGTIDEVNFFSGFHDVGSRIPGLPPESIGKQSIYFQCHQLWEFRLVREDLKMPIQ